MIFGMSREKTSCSIVKRKSSCGYATHLKKKKSSAFKDILELLFTRLLCNTALNVRYRDIISLSDLN
jgi:hypothetical protein